MSIISDMSDDIAMYKTDIIDLEERVSDQESRITQLLGWLEDIRIMNSYGKTNEIGTLTVEALK